MVFIKVLVYLSSATCTINMLNPKNGSKLPSWDFANPPNRYRSVLKKPNRKWHIYVCPTQSRPFSKPKEPFFANPKQKIINYSNIVMSKTFKQIKPFPLLTFVMLFFNFFTTNAQTTTFYGTSKVESDGHTGALYENEN